MTDPGLTAVLEKITPAQLAREIGCTPEAIYQWQRVPPRRVPAVAKASGIPAHVIRPDLYDLPPDHAERELRGASCA